MLGSPYIRTWQTARWFLALLVPISASVAASIVRGLPWLAVFTFAIIGIAVAFCLFATIASGVESSNWGTFFRRREPVQFWIGAGILAFIYAGMSVVGWFAQVDEAGRRANSPAVTSKPN